MNIKHTPGPWNVHGRDTRGLPHSLVAAETLIAKVYSKCYGDVEQETANAKLIAAAPDLLEALQAARDLWGDYLPPVNSNAMKAMKLVNAAISKATT